MEGRATFSGRSTILQARKREVSARTKMKALLRKAADTSLWLSPLLRQYRLSPKERQTDEWISLEEKMCLLQREEERSIAVMERLTNKLEILVGFMDYDRDTMRRLVQAGRFVAFSEGRVILEKDADPLGVYLILSGAVQEVNKDPPPLAYQIMSCLRQVGRASRRPQPTIKDDIRIRNAKEVFGEDEILSGKKRKTSVYPIGNVEFLYFEVNDFMNILKLRMLKRWKEIKNDLLNYRLFQYFTKELLDEVAKFGKYISVRPTEQITIKFDGKGKPENCYFLLKGSCQVLQRLLIVRDDDKKGFEKFKLYYFQEQVVFPDWVEPVYMSACKLHSGSYFGLGERLCRQPMIALTQCSFLVLPLELLEHLRPRLPAFQEALELLDHVFPSTIELFISYVRGRVLKDYTRAAVEACKTSCSNDNTIHNVPLTLRALKLKHLKRWRDAFARCPDYRLGLSANEVEELIDARRERIDDLNRWREHAFQYLRTY